MQDRLARRCWRRATVVLAACVAAGATVGNAATGDEGVASAEVHENPSKETQPGKAKSRYANKHCGLYCVYALLRVNGKEVDFRDLVKPEYLGAREGSSLAELRQAARDHGLYAEVVGNLTRKDLIESGHSIILHVKASAESKKYDHYKLFLEAEDGKAKILDPPGPTALIPFSELAPLWAGAGLVVSAEPLDTAALLAPARKRFALYIAVAMGLILLVRWGERRWLRPLRIRTRRGRVGLATVQGGVLATLAALAGFTYHFTWDAGFLSRGGAVASVEQARAETFAPKLDAEDVRALQDSDAVIVDARLARDYETGHMEGAVSVPVDATDAQRQQAMAGVPHNALIVIYCQSAGCPYAGKVARKLRGDGYTDISIYRDGWSDWEAKNEKSKEVSS